MQCLPPLSAVRYRLDFKIVTTLSLPAFAGSTLRGVFGSALRELACLTRRPGCAGCAMASSCPYAMVFEPRPPSEPYILQDFSQIPRPYLIEPPQWGERTYAPGETLSFHLLLTGPALQHLPLILWAFHRAFQQGVGKGDGTASLHQVWHANSPDTILLLDGPGGRIAEHDTQLPEAHLTAASAAILHFDRPLRLQNNGRRATAEEFTARRLLTTLLRRVSLIYAFHGTGALPHDFKALAAQADSLRSDKQLHWRDWSRYSSRQQQKIDLGGVVGTWTLSGDLVPFLPFLHLGQWLHVGKETTFGLGGYQLELHP